MGVALHEKASVVRPGQLLLLAVLTALGGIATGLYLPAFPAIALEYGTDAMGVQLTYWLYLLGFGVGQVIFGPLSDRFGRRRPLLISSGVFLIASVLVALAPTLSFMAVARIAQAIGAAGGVVISRAIVADQESGLALARKINLMMSLSMFAPVVAPLLGSIVLMYFPWNLTLWLIVPIGIVVLLGVVLTIPETLSPQCRRSRIEMGNLARVFRNRQYTCYVLISATASAALFAYMGASSFIYQNTLEYSVLGYGIVYGVNALGMVGFAYLSALLAKRGVQPAKTLGVGICILAAGSISMFVVPQAALPIAAGLYATGTIAAGLLAVIPIVAAAIAAMIGLQWLTWLRFTYTIGTDDIRVEQGILGREARSVPYERIQDVSLEQKLLPRLFGLAEVKFETGSGGSDEIVLAYVSAEEAERLRRLVRERRESAALPDTADPAGQDHENEAGQVLFAMNDGRVLTFGMFEFSLVIFAVLLGAAQQFDFLLPFDIWEWENWGAIFAGQREWIEHSGRTVQALAVIGGLLGVIALGSVTGIVRTFAREYGFVLERTTRGFRRRRGLFNRSDVTLPVHRVQAARVGTRLIRRCFGWYSLKFDSLARDSAGSSSHAVAPFAQLQEIRPLLRAAGIELPADDLAWRRPMPDPWIVDAIVLVGIVLAVGAGVSFFQETLLPFALALIAAVLSFVPTFGPIIALVPALLVGLLQGPTTALYVLGIYLGAEFVDNYIVSPALQRFVLTLPPALVIVTQVLLGLLVGEIGLLVAAPLVAAVVPLVRVLYVEGFIEGGDTTKAENAS